MIKSINAFRSALEEMAMKDTVAERTMADCEGMICKNCGDKFGMPTERKCMYDSKDPNGKNWKDDSDMNEEMDPVDQKAVKKKFADRKDKDIDNDGDVDASDKYLHKKRKAISKNINKNEDEPEGESKETAKMNPKTETKESTIRQRLMSIWEDAAGDKRMKDQNKEGPDEKEKNNKGAMDMKQPAKDAKVDDTEKLGHDDASQAGRAGPSKTPRSNDSKVGDANIINKIAAAYKGMK